MLWPCDMKAEQRVRVWRCQQSFIGQSLVNAHCAVNRDDKHDLRAIIGWYGRTESVVVSFLVHNQNASIMERGHELVLRSRQPFYHCHRAVLDNRLY